MQVLSESVSKALQMTGGPEVQETAKFVLMFDKFFDALNVGNFSSGRHHRKPFQAPYYSETDFRLAVCVNKYEICLLFKLCNLLSSSGLNLSF